MRKWENEHIEAAIIDYFDGTLSEADARSLEQFLEANPDLPQLSDFTDSPELDVKTDASVFEIDLSVQPDVLEPEQIDLLFAKQLEGDTSKDENRFIHQLLDDNAVIKAQHHIFQHLKVDEETEKIGLPLTKEDLGISSLDQLAIAHAEGDLTAREWKTVEQLAHASSDGLGKHLASAISYYSATKLKADTSLVFADKAALRKGAKVVPLWVTVVRRASVAAAILLLVGLGWFSLQGGGSSTGNLANTQNAFPAQIRSAEEGASAPIITLEQEVEAPQIEEAQQPKQNKAIYNVASFEEAPQNVFADTSTELQESVIGREASPFPLQKRGLASDFALAAESQYAFADLAPLHLPAVPAEVVPTVDALEDELYADSGTETINLSNRQEVVNTIKEKGSEIVFGDEELPEEGLGWALAERAVDAVGGDAELSASTEQSNSGWKVRLGKFSVSRY